jgi:non-ribosomal peptide synthetase component E (peptide arylation enzyme)
MGRRSGARGQDGTHVPGHRRRAIRGPGRPGAASRRRFGAAARAGFRHDQLRWRENNSGGEKIFAEEVEAAVTSHPSIADVIVTGRPSERWGQEVVALVQLVDCAQLDEAALARHAE